MGMIEHNQYNLTKKNQEETNKRLDAILAELKTLNQQIAWQNQQLANRQQPADQRF